MPICEDTRSKVKVVLLDLTNVERLLMHGDPLREALREATNTPMPSWRVVTGK